MNVTLNDDLMSRIDVYADESYMTRSGFISLACTQYLNQLEVLSAVKDMAVTMRKIADTGTLDDEQKQQLEDFERLSKMLVIH